MTNATYHITNLRHRDWARVGNVALAAVLAGVLAFASAQTARLSAANARNDAVVEKAFYETCELTEGMAVNLRKLLVAGETGQMLSLLSQTALQSQGALSNLALLPLGEATVSDTLKFINQVGDFAEALSGRLGSGGELTEADYEGIRALAASASAFSAGMGRLLDRYERGEAVFDASDFDETGRESLYPLANPASEYPTLLYDGPFSDGRTDGAFKALEGLAEVDEASARAAMRRFFGGADAEVTFTGESAVPVPCYEYTARVGNYAVAAGVTRAGGKVLYALCDTPVERASLTDAQAGAYARAFLERQGYGDMVLSYSSRFGGILTMNFAARAGDVVLYPDLVKVQVSLADGTVVGLESAGYWMNHVPRTLPEPALTVEQAENRVGRSLTPVAARLCVIPEGGTEALCYEIRAEAGESAFLVYIDAVTGEERRLMQVVSRADGEKVM